MFHQWKKENKWCYVSIQRKESQGQVEKEDAPLIGAFKKSEYEYDVPYQSSMEVYLCAISDTFFFKEAGYFMDMCIHELSTHNSNSIVYVSNPILVYKPK